MENSWIAEVLCSALGKKKKFSLLVFSALINFTCFLFRRRNISSFIVSRLFSHLNFYQKRCWELINIERRRRIFVLLIFTFCCSTCLISREVRERSEKSFPFSFKGLPLSIFLISFESFSFSSFYSPSFSWLTS